MMILKSYISFLLPDPIPENTITAACGIENLLRMSEQIMWSIISHGSDEYIQLYCNGVHSCQGSPHYREDSIFIHMTWCWPKHSQLSSSYAFECRHVYVFRERNRQRDRVSATGIQLSRSSCYKCRGEDIWTSLLRVMGGGAARGREPYDRASHLGFKKTARSGTSKPTAKRTFHSYEQGAHWGLKSSVGVDECAQMFCVYSHRLQFSLLYPGMSGVII